MSRRRRATPAQNREIVKNYGKLTVLMAARIDVLQQKLNIAQDPNGLELLRLARDILRRADVRMVSEGWDPEELAPNRVKEAS